MPSIRAVLAFTAKSNFGTKKVHFTRYELIKELDWRDESKSYERIEQSLRRWLGVTLYYDKAWWSKEEQCWVDESFHILEQVTIFDRERRERHRSARQDDPNAGLSSIVWNSVVFNSFKTGYLKQLDLELYKTLESRILHWAHGSLSTRLGPRYAASRSTSRSASDSWCGSDPACGLDSAPGSPPGACVAGVTSPACGPTVVQGSSTRWRRR